MSRGLTLTRLAELSGCTKGHLSQVERGRGGVRASPELLGRIESALGLEAGLLWGLSVLEALPAGVRRRLVRLDRELGGSFGSGGGGDGEGGDGGWGDGGGGEAGGGSEKGGGRCGSSAGPEAPGCGGGGSAGESTGSGGSGGLAIVRHDADGGSDQVFGQWKGSRRSDDVVSEADAAVSGRWLGREFGGEIGGVGEAGGGVDEGGRGGGIGDGGWGVGVGVGGLGGGLGLEAPMLNGGAEGPCWLSALGSPVARRDGGSVVLPGVVAERLVARAAEVGGRFRRSADGGGSSSAGGSGGLGGLGAGVDWCAMRVWDGSMEPGYAAGDVVMLGWWGVSGSDGVGESLALAAVAGGGVDCVVFLDMEGEAGGAREAGAGGVPVEPAGVWGGAVGAGAGWEGGVLMERVEPVLRRVYMVERRGAGSAARAEVEAWGEVSGAEGAMREARGRGTRLRLQALNPAWGGRVVALERVRAWCAVLGTIRVV